MQGGDFIIFAGATGMGKTCMMINIIASIAKLGFKVDVFSLEMSLKQLQNRLICSQTGVNSSKFRTKSFADYEKRVYGERPARIVLQGGKKQPERYEPFPEGDEEAAKNTLGAVPEYAE